MLSFLFLACGSTSQTTPDENPGLNSTGIAAVDQLSAEIAKDPDNAELYFLRGRALADNERMELAVQDAKKALSLNPEKVKYYQFLADAHFENNESQDAVLVLKQGLERFPDDFDLLKDLAELFLYVEQYRDGLTQVDKILKIKAHDPEIFFLQGNLFRYSGDTLNAINSYQRAVEEDSDYLEAYVLLAQIMEALDRPIALQYIQNALRIDSTNFKALEIRAQYFHQRGDFAKAKEAYTSLVYHHPQKSEPQYNMGLMFLELKEYQSALECFDRAVSFDPLFEAAYHFRGVSREALGNRQGAVADYRQALRIQNTFQPAIDALKRLGEGFADK